MKRESILYGYAGKILFVNLSSGTITEEIPSESIYRRFVGGTGLGVRILYEHIPDGVDPLGPDTMLGFVTGPFTGTGVMGGGRCSVVTKSPLTGAWADSSSGGYFGPALKRAGFDAVFFSGASNTPVYLIISDGRAELKNAETLWGKNTVETEEQQIK